MSRPEGKGLGPCPHPRLWTSRSSIPQCGCDAPKCAVCGHRMHVSLHMHALGESPGDPPFHHEYKPQEGNGNG